MAVENEAIDEEIVPAKSIAFGDVETTCVCWWEGWEGRECFRECDRTGNQIECHQNRRDVVDGESPAG